MCVSLEIINKPHLLYSLDYLSKTNTMPVSIVNGSLSAPTKSTLVYKYQGKAFRIMKVGKTKQPLRLRVKKHLPSWFVKHENKQPAISIKTSDGIKLSDHL